MEESNKFELNNNEAVSQHKYWMEEFKKCTEDQWYFYVNYTTLPDGTKPTISRDEFYAKLGFMKKNLH